MRQGYGEYPADWPVFARQLKDAAGWCCERCGHEHEPETGYTLTVHHLTMNKSESFENWWAFAVLCQRCHLTIQSKVILERQWLWEHSAWFQPHAAGFYAWTMGLPSDLPFVEQHTQALLDLGQHRITLAEFYRRTNAAPAPLESTR